MKYIFTLFSAFLFCSISLLHAQSIYGIKGSVNDSVSSSKLMNTTICVLNAKDSTLVKFTRASETGSFTINNLRKGKFILMVTYPDYADYVEIFQLDSIKHEKNFGKLNLKLKSRLLHEIMVQGTKAAIKIKGDTTEFNASSFVVQPNAKVEDLLKQLPGIQVDKDGKITAQGQKVSKVLVDGEEFFGDDPTLVTKNIRADMVDKVQLYDKKSDQASFTGIDDGVKNKTINIKLKEDKKNGFFGKVDVGVATDKYYQGQAALNVFKGKQKLAVYGTLANTGKTGLGWDDAAKYGGGANMEMTDDGGIYFSNSSRDELESFGGNYDGKGIPVARTAGAHYDGKWGPEKNAQSINGNYKIGYLAVNGFNEVLTQNNLPSGVGAAASVLNSASNQNYNNSIFRQKADLTYQLKIDSLTNIKVAVDGALKHSETNSSYLSSSYRNFDTLLNRSNRTLTNNLDGRVINASAFYNKKFKKAGRSFSWSVAEAYNDSKTAGYLKQVIEFYDNTPGILNNVQTTEQYKTGNTVSSNLNSNITYSEPFSKTLSMILNYGTGYNHSTSDRKSFDKGLTGSYNKLIDSLSNDYEFNQLSNQVGAVFNYRTAKTVLNIGTKATNVQFDQVNLVNNTQFKRSFINWNPQASYQYKFSRYRALNFNYNGSTTQPTIDQIQPVANNIDNLNITVGNASLRPSFNNRFGINYNSYKVLTGQEVYFSANYSFTTNPIVSNSTTDAATGKTIYQASNLNTKNPFNVSFYSTVGQKILGFNFNEGLNGNGDVSYNYSNGALNKQVSYTYAANLGIQRFKEKVFDIYLNFSPGYTVSQSSLQPQYNSNGLSISGYSFFNVYLPGKVQVGYDADYEYKAKTSSFNDDFSKLVFNTNISKKFLKDEGLKISLSANDLFNQNVGFNRTSSGSTITQNTYTSIKRYFMFSITYDFSKMGGGSPGKK